MVDQPLFKLLQLLRSPKLKRFIIVPTAAGSYRLRALAAAAAAASEQLFGFGVDFEALEHTVADIAARYQLCEDQIDHEDDREGLIGCRLHRFGACKDYNPAQQHELDEYF